MSEEAVDILYRNLHVFVRRAYKILGDKLDAEEAAQDAIAKVWKNLDAKTPEQAFAYTHRALLSVCIDKMRKRKTVSIEDIDRGSLIQNGRNGLEKDLAMALRKEVEDLPDDFSAVINDRYFNHLSYRQIAEKQGISHNTARTRLHRALNKLGEQICMNCPELAVYQVA